MPDRVKDDACERTENTLMTSDNLEACLSRPEVREHLKRCTRCASFAENLGAVKGFLERDIAEPLREEVFRNTLSRCGRFVGAPGRRGLLLRLTLAGVLAFPPIAAVNVATSWVVYSIAAAIVPLPAARVVLAFWIALASFGMAISYGSLPFFSLLPFEGAAPRRISDGERIA
jgi:anti-sigma factor RsiW